MSPYQQPVDRRPFRSKAERAREQSLETQYRRIAIPDVVAALPQLAAGTPPTTASDEQMR